jgi:RHS repeat-associated protein
VVEQITYDAFGNSSGSAYTRYTYTGREFDTDTGLYYYRARFYDPVVGRFISEDPIGFDGGLNWYGYVENDPIDFSDPTGLSKGDRWYGYRNRDFHKWFHRCWKQSGEADADKEGIEEAHKEWISRGSPKGGNCWGGGQPDPSACKEPAPMRKATRLYPTAEEYRLQAESHRQMEQLWTKVLLVDVAAAAALLAPEGAAVWVLRSVGGALRWVPALPLAPAP